MSLAQLLRERGEIAEKERAKLTVIEKEVCENACMRLKVRDESAKLDAILSEQHCKAAQLDRDFQVSPMGFLSVNVGMVQNAGTLLARLSGEYAENERACLTEVVNFFLNAYLHVC